mmetsp:Transcript_143713/g.374284  ORF Transcript_143713/g.374284 Transcript_143713/m.374284 type:complete len:253 (+) Transcript_143713:88-846(+)
MGCMNTKATKASAAEDHHIAELPGQLAPAAARGHGRVGTPRWPMHPRHPKTLLNSRSAAMEAISEETEPCSDGKLGGGKRLGSKWDEAIIGETTPPLTARKPSTAHHGRVPGGLALAPLNLASIAPPAAPEEAVRRLDLGLLAQLAAHSPPASPPRTPRQSDGRRLVDLFSGRGGTPEEEAVRRRALFLNEEPHVADSYPPSFQHNGSGPAAAGFAEPRCAALSCCGGAGSSIAPAGDGRGAWPLAACCAAP